MKVKILHYFWMGINSDYEAILESQCQLWLIGESDCSIDHVLVSVSKPKSLST